MNPNAMIASLPSTMSALSASPVVQIVPLRKSDQAPLKTSTMPPLVTTLPRIRWLPNAISALAVCGEPAGRVDNVAVAPSQDQKPDPLTRNHLNWNVVACAGVLKIAA